MNFTIEGNGEPFAVCENEIESVVRWREEELVLAGWRSGDVERQSRSAPAGTTCTHSSPAAARGRLRRLRRAARSSAP
jgi:hypothetical protein